MTIDEATDTDIFLAYVEHVLCPTLEPGDVIATGTPDGVGFARTPPEFLKDGDVMEVDIGGIGVLRNTIVLKVPAVVR